MNDDKILKKRNVTKNIRQLTEAELNDELENEKNNVFFNEKFVMKLKLTDKNEKKKKNNKKNNKKKKNKMNNIKKKNENDNNLIKIIKLLSHVL